MVLAMRAKFRFGWSRTLLVRCELNARRTTRELSFSLRLGLWVLTQQVASIKNLHKDCGQYQVATYLCHSLYGLKANHRRPAYLLQAYLRLYTQQQEFDDNNIILHILMRYLQRRLYLNILYYLPIYGLSQQLAYARVSIPHHKALIISSSFTIRHFAKKGRPV